MNLILHKFPVHPLLSPYIRNYYSIESFETEKTSFFLSNHPHGTIDLLFCIRGKTTIEILGRKNEKLSGIFVIAQQTQNFQVCFDTETVLIGIVFNAESFVKFFNFPVAELSNSAVALNDHLNKEFIFFLEKMNELPDHKSRIFSLDKFLLKQMTKYDISQDKLDLLVRHIRTQQGNISVQELAFHSGIGIRTMQRRIKEKLGLSPKGYASIIRFNYALHLIKSHPESNWQDIIFLCGYYDQMHFIKDFRRFTGQTPIGFIKCHSVLHDFFMYDVDIPPAFSQ